MTKDDTLKKFVDKFQKDISEKEITSVKKINKLQGNKLNKEKESMINMFNPKNNNYYDSIVENINYTECINGKCSVIELNNTTKNNNTNNTIIIDKFKTSNILKNNINYLVFIIYILVLIINFVNTLIYRKSIYLINIIIATLVFIIYKILMV